MKSKQQSAMDQLLGIMAQLRHPETGCPWDLEQDFKSITPHTIEEVYEVVDAIEKEDILELKAELGDLLLQIVFYAQMAQEEGSFGFENIVESINEKLIRRHPHVFGEEKIKTAQQQEASWETIKAEERKEKNQKQESILHDVPAALPALMRAAKLQKRASKVGFDWANIAQVKAKIQEELHELAQAIDKADGSDAIEAELGDVLFAIVNMANRLKVEPETALRRTNDKFIRRFSYIEQQLEAANQSWDDVDLTMMDKWWNEAKKHENE